MIFRLISAILSLAHTLPAACSQLCRVINTAVSQWYQQFYSGINSFTVISTVSRWYQQFHSSIKTISQCYKQFHSGIYSFTVVCLSGINRFTVVTSFTIASTVSQWHHHYHSGIYSFTVASPLSQWYLLFHSSIKTISQWYLLFDSSIKTISQWYLQTHCGISTVSYVTVTRRSELSAASTSQCSERGVVETTIRPTVVVAAATALVFLLVNRSKDYSDNSC